MPTIPVVFVPFGKLQVKIVVVELLVIVVTMIALKAMEYKVFLVVMN